MTRLTEGKHYWLTTEQNGKTVEFQKPINDPFVRCVLTTKFGWRTRLRILFGMEVSHSVTVGAEPAVISAVMRLAWSEPDTNGDCRIILEPLSESDPACKAGSGFAFGGVVTGGSSPGQQVGRG